MLSTVGRGGNAQAVRDEILNIMHRNNIKEKNGTWMEQWHQKLHNNTTPDDIGICEAYIAFLKADGDNGVYWRVLSDHGAPAHICLQHLTSIGSCTCRYYCSSCATHLTLSDAAQPLTPMLPIIVLCPGFDAAYTAVCCYYC